MKWRKWNNVIHRDLGYLCFGLTILYVISGVAVNHIQDWNPTYRIERLSSAVDLSGVDTADNNALALTVLGQLGETAPLKNIFRHTLKQTAESRGVFGLNILVSAELLRGAEQMIREHLKHSWNPRLVYLFLGKTACSLRQSRCAESAPSLQ